MINKTQPKIVFFGTPEFSVKILESMKNAGLAPALIITAPDKPQGRKLRTNPSPVKLWALKNKIKILQPDNLKDLGFKIQELGITPDLFVVASFGKILPKKILEIPKHETINVHPSLLPKLRGPSPIQSAILNGEKETGVTIMLMDEKMDEGPILKISNLKNKISNLTYKKLEEKLAELGGEMLVETMPRWLNNEIKPIPQNHNKATYTKLFTKKDGEIDWNEPPEIIERKIRALAPWPGAYTFYNGKRIIIAAAELDDKGKLVIKRVKPEGKKEMECTNLFSQNIQMLAGNKRI
ncbi:methionyl-tRNA formyltransferase [Patescibacteria group bacterium]|nr:methionyl-tRNA formyltransferase [Patescibacteria group bacterium]